MGKELGELDGLFDGVYVGVPVGGVMVGGELIVGLDVGNLVGLVDGVSVAVILARQPVNLKHVCPGVVHSESAEEGQGREQSLAAWTQEEPQ